jgi:hypothetical protein
MGGRSRKGEPRVTHGLSRAKCGTYQAWRNIKARCRNPNNRKYPRYGGRGIDICDDWFHSFEAFLAEVGRRPAPHLTIGRIDNERGYEPGNVEWQTRGEQARTSYRPVIRSDGARFNSITAAAEAIGRRHETIWGALNGKWPTAYGYGWKYDVARVRERV